MNAADELLDKEEHLCSRCRTLSNVNARTLLTYKDLAKYLKVSLPTINRWRKSGTGPKPLKLGKLVRYRLADVDAYLDALAVAAKPTEIRLVVGECSK